MTNLTENGNDGEYNLKGYMFFWSGQLVSLLGSAIIQFVIIWWLTVRTKSALYLSFANIAGFLPFIILTPIAGVFVDRWNRKILIGSVDFLQAVVTVGLVFLFMFENQIFNYNTQVINFDLGTHLFKYERFLSNNGPITFVWVILLILAVRGSLQAFQGPAIQAIIPIMVPRKHLNRINSIDYLTNSVIFLIGPVVAALLLAIPFLDVKDLLWIDAITFVVAVIPMLMIKIPKVTKAEKQQKKESSFREEFSEGIRFIRQKKGLLSLLGVFTGANLFLTPLFTLLNLYIYAGHGGNETNLAFIMAFFQAGMIGSSVLLIFWKGFKKKVVGVAGGIFVTYIGYLWMSVTPMGWFWFMGIGSLIMGLMLPILNLSSQYIWQTIVPKEKLGRVMSVRQTLAQFSAPVGMILAGLIADAADAIRPVLWGSVALGLAVLAYSWFFTNMRHVEDDIDYNKSPDEIPSLEIESISNSEPSPQDVEL